MDKCSKYSYAAITVITLLYHQITVITLLYHQNLGQIVNAPATRKLKILIITLSLNNLYL
jgi:hypothetical protein